MKKIKKIVAILLVIILPNNFIFDIYANDKLSKEMKNIEGISEALQGIESYKSEMNLEDIDFQTLAVGQRINSYIYENKTFKENFSFFPLFDNDLLVAFAILVDAEENIYQITTSLVKEVNSYIKPNERFTFIYDSNGCYIYSERGLCCIENFELEIAGRDLIDKRENMDFSMLMLNDMSPCFNMNDMIISQSFEARPYSSTQTYYKCDVKHVSSHSGLNLCWAATIACIVNYFKGTDLTAIEVAEANVDRSELTKGQTSKKQEEILRKYGINYTYKNKVPSNMVILRNIKSGCPFKVGFKSGTNYHAVVAYGINLIAGSLSIMDPMGRFETAIQYSDGYKYISPYSGAEFTAYDAICKYWVTSYK